MLYARFWQLIDASAIGGAVTRRREILEQTNPDRISVENVRAFFRVPHGVARSWCELAVREGVFSKRVGLLCPEDRHIVVALPNDAPIPPTIACKVCEAEEREEFDHPTVRMDRLPIYSLVRAGDADNEGAS